MIFENFASAHLAVLSSIFVLALIIGVVANKSNFCTMGAVSDVVNMGDSSRMRAWFLAMTVALIGVIIIEATGFASIDSTLPPYRSSNFAWLEYVLGGVLFGIGMTLGSGCGNKTLVRIGGGNLKSIVVFAILSVFAYFMINPFPGSDSTIYSTLFYPWTNPASISLSTQQDLGSVVGNIIGTEAGMTRTVIGLVLAAAMLRFIFKSADFRSSADSKLGGFTVGAAVLAAWVATASLASIDADGEKLSWVEYASAESWDMLEDDADARPRDVAVQSFTFVNPIGQTTRYIVKGFDKAYLTAGLVAIAGIILGSFLWSLMTKSFRIEWFVDFKDFFTHLVGAALMGTGGILALGCTFGQGITGISTLSMGSVVALVSIIFGSAMTMKVQYYKLIHEDEGTFIKAFIIGLVDFKMLPESMRKLENY